MVAVGGKGAHIITADGGALLDLVSSWWVNLHGHGHPAIAAAMAQQAARLEQVIFADFTHAPAACLAARLAGLLPGDLDRVFYSDNGSTAVEVALKVALQYFPNRGEDRRRRLLAFKAVITANRRGSRWAEFGIFSCLGGAVSRRHVALSGDLDRR